ncbi:cell division topological specificity factor-like protein, chloroplastic [Iris pallida]|uniref:Cell division topological specificity factor-like protein, chloroplastic n=1 Tax=Iris pallida TaxID=29817 RepID=A0AAX6GHT0_IRIPA|nr:cell division topological specificity factor-like protein, chloroplastic [Iris pallida]
MAISGDLKLSFFPLRPILSPSKICFTGFSTGRSHDLRSIAPKWPHIKLQGHGSRGGKPSVTNQDTEGFLLNSTGKSFSERLSLARRILFPSAKETSNSNARIAKQRLRMILCSDRCEVSDEAKGKIVSSIVQALSDFVEIESQDEVQLNISNDEGLGTVYSVAVPVRRVKPEYRDSEEDYRGEVASIEYKDTGESSGTVDVKFNFFQVE